MNIQYRTRNDQCPSLRDRLVLRSTFYVLRSTFYVLRSTFYVLRSTFYVLRSTFYVLRSTFYVLRSTFYVLRSTFYVLRSTFYVFPWPINHPERIPLARYEMPGQSSRPPKKNPAGVRETKFWITGSSPV